ncbi:AAA family ATPase [Microvirga sp. STS02]|uniref:AAA family ATPase n=1 Tax=Hymenobacter negativus TaxID=2795026 RepID=UPI0018DE48B9|nr:MULTISPECIES: ATP-binding protein [Bacteria]MBH8570118.1 AAA family ATPase [Hymenobacter negativus]MBR7209858.1 AAA family ATPase [Microvirga sp. STS02]
MNITFADNYKSISPFEWHNIAALSIITGLNGAGKSQLLQVISNEYNQAVSNNKNNQVEKSNAFGSHSLQFGKSNQGANAFGQLYGGDKGTSYGDLKTIVDLLYKQKHPENNSGMYYDPQQQQQLEQIRQLSETRINQNGLYSTVRYKSDKIWRYLTTLLNKPEQEITPSEIAIFLPEHIIFEDQYVINAANLDFIFFMFEFKRISRIKEGLPALDLTPPWQLLNEAIEASSLPYRVSAPESEDIEVVFRSPLNESVERPFKIKITHVSEGYELGFHDLSSGERIIMSLAMLLYYSKERGIQEEILLLDEPDAHLHPSMTKQFFKVVYDVLVKRHGVTVIMTTHSPSTVALAPEGDDCVIYELRKKPTTITPVTSREEAINSLTEGMVLVMSSTRVVLIEGKDDKPFYEALYRILNSNNLLNGNANLVFLAGTGKDSVNNWSHGLREAGLSEAVRGIIDKDNGNAVSDGIFMLDRYSIENYMLDPILVLATGRTIPDSIPKYGITSGEEDKIRALSQDQIQAITDAMLLHVKPKLRNLQLEEEVLVPVGFNNGFAINYPQWFLSRKGKELLGIFNDEFGRNLSREALTTSFKRIQLVPTDIVELFRRVQA